MDFTILFSAIIEVLLAVVILIIIPFLNEKIGVSKVTTAYQIIKILVQTIEKVTKESGQGKKKKEWVINRLKEYNIKLDESKVSDLIESAVLELDNAILEKVE